MPDVLNVPSGPGNHRPHRDYEDTGAYCAECFEPWPCPEHRAATELRGNWEPDNHGWTHQPAERTCHLCRRNRMHTKAEHDLVYPVDRQVLLDWEREEERRQAKADEELMARFVADGMTEEQAADELWAWAAQGRGLVEPRPRP